MSKLVRDLIPDVIPEEKRSLYRFTELDPSDYRKRLKEKLLEEVEEFFAAENSEEIADIYEVLDALMKDLGIEKSEALKIQQEKKLKRGGFEKKLLMETL
ncbi:MAG: phosphoribosyl-ATP pyrophosphohydrolase [Chlamydiia bacterium]|nr:phosphoribosyl-ATP pyrophosphohydrolase [Chlamydiia bacterium]